ncbi:hypothetical protein [Streptomyces sp. NPDC059224]|uniref:hypothetical protein n=1 Tax=Streptomyces sp. NPDC059224 TaxID=3346775 RepID=UPI0036ACE68B
MGMFAEIGGEGLAVGRQGDEEPLSGPVVPGREIVGQQVEHAGLAFVHPAQQHTDHALGRVGGHLVDVRDHVPNPGRARESR